MKWFWCMFPCVFLASSARAEGDEDETPLEVTLSLVEPKSGERRAVLELKLPIADAHGCSRAELNGSSSRHELSICREGGSGERPILSLNLERRLFGAAVESRRFQLRAAVATGRRVTVGRVSTPEGALEIDWRVDPVK